ncbi:MAG TPA: response regulator [Nevskiaceae bacterium]|nr:response regulator [Nevskiaceae bacterium]
MTSIQVLVVDDEPEAAAPLVRTLQAQQWRVSVAENGRQGFHRAQALSPDVILLDVYMPGMDGYATCRLLKSSPRTRDIPVIFLTSAAAAAERLGGFECGGADYVIKPCLPAELVARIAVHARSHRESAASAATAPMSLLSDGEVLVHAAAQWIGAHLADPPALDDIARAVGSYDKQLSRAFREHLGVTVFQWIREERLRVARGWLADSGMSVGDIATQVGFVGATNFSTAFRLRFGVTPTQYRDSARASRAP